MSLATLFRQDNIVLNAFYRVCLYLVFEMYCIKNATTSYCAYE